MTGERRRRDALQGCELAEREVGVLAHEPQERRLPARDAQRLSLPAQLARETEQHRAQSLRGDRNIGSFTNH